MIHPTISCVSSDFEIRIRLSNSDEIWEKVPLGRRVCIFVLEVDVYWSPPQFAEHMLTAAFLGS